MKIVFAEVEVGELLHILNNDKLITQLETSSGMIVSYRPSYRDDDMVVLELTHPRHESSSTCDTKITIEDTRQGIREWLNTICVGTAPEVSLRLSQDVNITLNDGELF